MKKAVALLGCLLVLACKGQTTEDQSTVVTEEVVEQKKLHWWELPIEKDSDGKVTEFKEMRTKENQEKMRLLWEAFDRLEKRTFTEDYLTMEEIQLTNDLYYQALKFQGFQFPSEAVFAQRIQEIFKVDIFADHTGNPRIVRKGDFLLLLTKVYPAKYRKIVPTIDFDAEGYVFDLKRRFLTEIGIINGRSEVIIDDFGEKYFVYANNSPSLGYNNYIFYNSKAALVKYYQSLPAYFIKNLGSENFDQEVYVNLHQAKLKEFRQYNKGVFIYYAMYERFLFSRDFNGELKPKIKMLETMVELAKEDPDYATNPLDYYSRQIRGIYVNSEYAADEYIEGVDPYKNIEPFYTKEERAKIWAYLAYYEAEILEHYRGRKNELRGWDYSTYADSSQNISGYFYQEAKAHDFYGLDFTKVQDEFLTERGLDWEEIICSWPVVEPEEIKY